MRNEQLEGDRLGSADVTVREPMVVTDIDAVRRQVSASRRRDEVIGLVPTMGALHAGHSSLIERARRECDFVVVTLFVNPTQFCPTEDFEKYPRPFEADYDACRGLGVDLIFQPSDLAMYPENFATYVEVEGLSRVLEGECRPGHFRGVSTIVLKLLNCVAPDIVYFGQKDYQQQALVRKMCQDLNVNVEIRTCPTVRESDGLALSSRNKFLNSQQRQSALSLHNALMIAHDRLTDGETDVESVRRAMREHLDSTPEVSADYATVAHPETLEEIDKPLKNMIALVAARVGETRLIDNMLIEL